MAQELPIPRPVVPIRAVLNEVPEHMAQEFVLIFELVGKCVPQ